MTNLDLLHRRMQSLIDQLAQGHTKAEYLHVSDAIARLHRDIVTAQDVRKHTDVPDPIDGQILVGGDRG